MGFRKVDNVIFCGIPDCEAVYMWDGKTEGGDIRAKTVLPCGHEIAKALLCGSCIRDNNKASEMLDYLDRNGMIKAGADEAIREKGGRFDDALNIDVPPEDLTAAERRKL